MPYSRIFHLSSSCLHHGGRKPGFTSRKTKSIRRLLTGNACTVHMRFIWEVNLLLKSSFSPSKALFYDVKRLFYLHVTFEISTFLGHNLGQMLYLKRKVHKRQKQRIPLKLFKLLVLTISIFSSSILKNSNWLLDILKRHLLKFWWDLNVF